MNRIDRLEGLRGLLAWWVVIAHAMQWAGIKHQQVPEAFSFLYLGIIPVYGFMFLSGFVITHLMEVKKEAYGTFITRRYFRLAPLLVACMIAGFIIEQILPQTNFFPADNAVLRIISHVSLMFGVFPNEVFAGEAVAFVSPAWSISLEWQFYLVAPLLLAGLKGNRLGMLIICLFLGFALYVGYNMDARKFSVLGEVYTYSKPSLLFSVLPYFLLGMMARLLWALLDGGIKGNILLFAAVFMAALFLDVRDSTMLRWQIVPMLAIVSYVAFTSNDLVAKFLEHPIIVFLGRVSYSTYLLHYFVVALASIYLRPLVGGGWTLFWAMMVVTVPSTIIVSHLSYRFIEMPGNRVGLVLSKRLFG